MSWTTLIECLWPSIVWGVVLVMGIYTESQHSPPAITRSQPGPHHLVGPHRLVLQQLILHNLVTCLLVPHHRGPSFKILPAQSWVPGTVTTRRYVGSILAGMGGVSGAASPWACEVLVPGGGSSALVCSRSREALLGFSETRF